jgi:dephospho-CoA kinase
LTGGVASGKSTVAQLFVALGAKLIDTDQIVAPGSPALAAITHRFGPDVLTDAGTLNRGMVRDLVFRDGTARADLEAITHPRIRVEVARLSEQLGGPYQLLAIPLLVETGSADNYDRILVVDCEPQAQLRRLMLRDGLDAAAAGRMVAAQVSRAERLARADDVIENNGDIARLAMQVEVLHRRYLQLRSP